MLYLTKALNSTDLIDYLIVTISILVVVACFIFVRTVRGGRNALTIKILATIGTILAASYGILTFSFKEAYLFILLGLVFSLVGDIMLDLKVIDRKNDTYYTNVGMGSFALTHVMYLFAILCLTDGINMLAPVLVSVSISLAVSSLIMLVLKKPLKLDFGKFFWQSYIYSFILIFMTAFSIYLSFFVSGLWIFALGLLLFLLSDLVLSTQYFGNKLDNKLLIIVNHTLYYLAQISIYSVIFFI